MLSHIPREIINNIDSFIALSEGYPEKTIDELLEMRPNIPTKTLRYQGDTRLFEFTIKAGEYISNINILADDYLVASTSVEMEESSSSVTMNFSGYYHFSWMDISDYLVYPIYIMGKTETKFNHAVVKYYRDQLGVPPYMINFPQVGTINYGIAERIGENLYDSFLSDMFHNIRDSIVYPKDMNLHVSEEDNGHMLTNLYFDAEGVNVLSKCLYKLATEMGCWNEYTHYMLNYPVRNIDLVIE